VAHFDVTAGHGRFMIGGANIKQDELAEEKQLVAAFPCSSGVVYCAKRSCDKDLLQ